MADKVKLTPPMTDSKTPEWAGSRYSVHIIPANNKVQMLERSDGDWVKFSDASIALLSAYERGRKEGIEEAAKVADRIGKERSAQWSSAKATGKPMQSIDVGYVGYAIRQLLEVKG